MNNNQKNTDYLYIIKRHPIFLCVLIFTILFFTFLFFCLPPGWLVLGFLYNLYINGGILGKIIFYFVVITYLLLLFVIPADFINENE
ncbi:hypothetical protein ACW0S0_01725 [Fusobacterium polymorphum]